MHVFQKQVFLHYFPQLVVTEGQDVVALKKAYAFERKEEIQNKVHQLWFFIGTAILWSPQAFDFVATSFSTYPDMASFLEQALVCFHKVFL